MFGVPLLTLYAVKIRREIRDKAFPDPSRQFIVALGGQKISFSISPVSYYTRLFLHLGEYWDFGAPNPDRIQKSHRRRP